MAITRIIHFGAEVGNTYELDGTENNISASTTSPKTGSYCYLGNALNSTCYIQQSISSTYQTRFGYHFRITSWTTSNAYNSVELRNGGTILAYLLIHRGTTTMSLYVGGVLRDTYIYSWNVSVWEHFGFDVKIDSSNGWVKIYLAGSEILSYQGNTGSTQINNIRVGKTSGFVDGTFTIYLDDLYFDDTTGEASPTAPPIKKFYPINVNGDGNYSQWTPIPTGSHYQNVDERPPNDNTDYLEAVTGSLLDSFTMTTFTLDTNENIIAMIPFVIAKRGSTTEKISLGTRSSGTDSLGTAQDLSTSYDYYWERQTTGSLGFDWNQSYLDSVEVLINSTGTY